MKAWSRTERHLPWVILGVTLLVALLTLRDYGVTINEPFEASVGEAGARFYRTWHLADLPDTKLGVFFDVVGTLVARLATSLGARDPYLGWHLFNALVGCAGLLGIHRLGESLWSRRVGTLAMAILALAPRYYGAIFNDPKDVPFAATFIWAAWALVRLLRRPTVRNAALCGALGALCFTARPQGLFFVGLGAAACLWPTTPADGSPWKRLAALLSVALPLTVVLWPVILANPPWHLFDTATTVSHEGGGPSLFMGTVHAQDSQPPSYVAIWLAVTLPLPTLVLALLGAGLSLRDLRALDRRRVAWIATVAGIWVLLPIGIPFVHRVPMYHSVRHFLFVMPALCLLAAFALDRIASLTWFTAGKWRRPALALVAVGCYADVLAADVRLHPYEGLYFGRVVGGMRGASSLFDVAYYGETYGEAFRWLSEHAPTSSRPVHVTALGGPFTRQTFAYYADRFGMQLDTPEVEYFIAQVQDGNEKRLPGEVLHTIERDGVPLAVVVRTPPFETVQKAWYGPPWHEIDAGAGEPLPLGHAGAMLTVPIVSRVDQVVPLLLGFDGELKIAVNPARAILSRRSELRSVFPAARIDLPVKAGLNAVLFDLEDVDRSRGLVLELESDRSVRLVPPPGAG